MLDQAISSALHRMHNLERAVHDPGPWAIVVHGIRYPASRVLTDRGVCFTATINDRRMGMVDASLECDSQLVAAKRVDLPDNVVVLDWSLSLDEVSA